MIVEATYHVWLGVTHSAAEQSTEDALSGAIPNIGIGLHGSANNGSAHVHTALDSIQAQISGVIEFVVGVLGALITDIIDGFSHAIAFFPNDVTTTTSGAEDRVGVVASLASADSGDVIGGVFSDIQ